MSDPRTAALELVHHAPVFIIYVDRAEKYTFVNAPYAARFGLNPEDIIGRNVKDVLGEEAYNSIKPYMDEVVRTGKRVEYESIIPYRDLGPQHMRVAYEPELDASGQVVGYIGAIINDTPLRKAVGALRLNEERLELAQQAAQIGTFEIVLKTGATTWSRSLEKLFGLAEGSFGGTQEHFKRLVHPEDLPHYEKELAEALTAGRGLDTQFRIIRGDGQMRWMSSLARVIPGADGRPERMVGVNVDITEQKKNDDLLREEARIRETLNRIGLTLSAELDLSKLLQAVTDAATRLADAQFGAFFYNAVNALGESYMLYSLSGAPREAFSKYPMPRNTPLFNPTFQGQGVIRLSDVTKDPRYGKNPPYNGMPKDHLPVRSYLAVPVISRSGVLGGLFFGHSDVGVFTERHERLVVGIAAQAGIAVDNARLYEGLSESAEKLAHADRRKDEFLATLAHELRNPLAPIRNGLQLIRRSNGDPERTMQTVEVMERQLSHLVRLVEDLLDLSRVNKNILELRRQTIEVKDVITAAVETSQPVLDSKKHKLEISLPPEPLVLEADFVRLAQVVSNLLNNAAKYSEQGTTIRVSAVISNGDLLLSVRDEGIGIPQEMTERVFDMFTRLEKTKSDPRAGLGIGLTLVKHIVELHGGSVEAKSAGPQKGSTLIVRLPGARTARAAESARPPSKATPTEKKVEKAKPAALQMIVADDNHDAAETMGILLQMSGHTVEVVFDGQQALDAFERVKPDAMLLDIGMPVLNGYEVARKIRAHPNGKKTMLVALTGWGKDDDKQRAYEAGFNLHLTKPVDPDRLNDILRGLK